MHRLGFCLLAALAGATAIAQADPPGSNSATRLRSSAHAMDCTRLAAMPNPPMSVHACEAAKASGLDLADALGHPGEAGPDDAALSCEQIAQEMQALQVQGVSATHAADAVSAGEALQRTQQQSISAAQAMAARQGLQTASAAGAPNAIAGAVAMQQHAEQQALARDASARRRVAMDRVLGAQADATQDLAASLRAHPRWARLLALGAARCADHPLFNGTADP